MGCKTVSVYYKKYIFWVGIHPMMVVVILLDTQWGPVKP